MRYAYYFHEYDDARLTAKALVKNGGTEVSLKKTRTGFCVNFSGCRSLFFSGRNGVKYSATEDGFLVIAYLSGFPIDYLSYCTHRKFSAIETRLKKLGFYPIDRRNEEALGNATFLEGYYRGEYDLDTEEDDNEHAYIKEDIIKYLGSLNYENEAITKSLEKAIPRCDLFGEQLFHIAKDVIVEKACATFQIAFYRFFGLVDKYYEILSLSADCMSKAFAVSAVRDRINLHIRKRTEEAIRELFSGRLFCIDKKCIVTFLEKAALPSSKSLPGRTDHLALVLNDFCWGARRNPEYLTKAALRGDVLASALFIAGDFQTEYRDRQKIYAIAQRRDCDFALINSLISELLPLNEQLVRRIERAREQSSEVADIITSGLGDANRYISDRLYDRVERDTQALGFSTEEIDSCDEKEWCEYDRQAGEARLDWGEMFDDLGPGYWADYLGGPDDAVWENLDEAPKQGDDW